MPFTPSLPRSFTWTFLFLSLALVRCSSAPEANTVAAEEVAIIPAPAEFQIGKGAFLLNENVTLTYASALAVEAEWLAQAMRAQTGLELQVMDAGQHTLPDEEFVVLLEPGFAQEAYHLEITPSQIRLKAFTRQGIFHGMQSVLQILPRKKGAALLPALKVEDAPQFSHRGMLLDCCRHFWPVEVVKKYIDLLAFYKMNVLHWHLTEDQGWRIEIKKYPTLTEVGSWRTEADGSRYGGFYSQEEIKDIVAYAQARHISVIPEIEMPGHSLAALAAYPNLACTDGPFEVTSEWGVFKDVYCAGNEETFTFLEDVLMEVMALFPSEKIHIGGDESPKFRWKHCDKCQARMAAEGLEDEHALQSYFIQRIEGFLHENGKQLIGWDEILEGGIPSRAIVQSWRGMQGAIEAAEHGNQAIVSPTSHCYLDYGLDAIDLEKIYHFSPIPSELDPALHDQIIGGECNMWTEHVPDEDNLDSKVLPRMIGLAEALWSKTSDFEDFTERLEMHYPRLEQWGFNYGFASVPVAFHPRIEKNRVIVSIEKSHPDLVVLYTTDNSQPHFDSPEWKADSAFSQSNPLKMIALQNGRLYPKTFELPVKVHRALGSSYSTNLDFSPYYTAGGHQGLTDGIAGSLDFRDGRWQGFEEKDLEIIIDLGRVQSVSTIGTHCYQYINAWIFAPTRLAIEVSEDAVTYTPFATITPDHDLKATGQFIEQFIATAEAQNARFVKLTAESIGTCPDWHDAAGSPAWLFIDEIIVQ